MSRSHSEREELISQAFVTLADTLVDEYDVIDLLDRLTGFCVQLLPADAAGIVWATRGGSCARWPHPTTPRTSWNCCSYRATRAHAWIASRAGPR
jgi:hypothetical protein